jgi:hypothetical protein
MKTILMNYLGGLVNIKQGCDNLCVVVARFNKMVQLIPSKKSMPREIILLENMVTLWIA